MTAQLPSREMLSQTIERITDAIDDVVRLYGEHWDSALVGGEPNYHAITNEQAVVVRTADDSLHSSWLCDYLEAVDPASVRLLLARIKELDKAAHEQGPVAYSLIFKNMDGVLNSSINTNTTFATREKAEAYGRGGRYETQPDGSLKWVADENLDPIVVPLYTHPAPVPAVPNGYVLMPMKLTAENGAKYALSGEFHVLHRVTCHECGGEGCSDCDDDGWLEEKIMIGWDDIKDIYRAAVEACSIKSTGEGV